MFPIQKNRLPTIIVKSSLLPYILFIYASLLLLTVSKLTKKKEKDKMPFNESQVLFESYVPYKTSHTSTILCLAYLYKPDTSKKYDFMKHAILS